MSCPVWAESGDVTAVYIAALAHPVRRGLLRMAHKLDGEPVSPARASETLDEALSNVSYHTKCLADAGLLTLAYTKPVRGALEHFYRLDPSAVEHPLIHAFLTCDSKS